MSVRVRGGRLVALASAVLGWETLRSALFPVLMVGLTAFGCGTLGIDLDPNDIDFGDGSASGGRKDNGGTGTGAESSSGGQASHSGGGEANLGGADAAGGESNSGGESGSGGDSGTGGAAAESDCSEGAFGTLTMLDTLEVEGDKWGPTITGDRLVLYFALSGTSGETIYRSTRAAKDQPFGAATEVTELNATARQGTPFVNYDDTSIYFFRQTTSNQNTRNLWHASRSSRAEPFSNPTELSELSSDYREHLPWLTKDELTIYFASARGTSSPETDLWMATRSSMTDTFDDLTLVEGLDDGDSEDQSPAMTPDGLTLYFTTNYLTSLDVYSARRENVTSDFGTPVREDELSSSGDDTNLALSPDGREFFLSSGRSGGQELWVATRDCD